MKNKCFAIIGIARNKPIYYWKNFSKQGFFTWANSKKEALKVVTGALEKEGVKFEVLKIEKVFEKL